MEEITKILSEPHQIILLLASLLNIAGAVARDQLTLRLFLIVTALLTITYHATATKGVSALVLTLILIPTVIHSWRIVGIMLDRRNWNMTEEERELYGKLSGISMGDFRRLISGGKWFTAAEETYLTVEGQEPNNLFYISTGRTVVFKNERKFDVEAGLFIGEIAWLLGTPATATVTVAQGSRYIVWDRKILEVILARSPTLANTFNGLLNRDLAKKLVK